jgi:hypothetical protein
MGKSYPGGSKQHMNTTYIIRIIEPADVASIAETRTFHNLEEVDGALVRLAEKLHFHGIAEYVIHVIDQTTGAVVRTQRRVVGVCGRVEDAGN